MNDDRIVIKGNKDGINVIIPFHKFDNFNEVLSVLKDKLEKGKKFYEGCNIKISTELKELKENEVKILKELLFEEFNINECIFQDTEEKMNKAFNGVYEGKTKFIKRTLRSGQVMNYPGNIVIVGDVNSGSEIFAGGNIIVMGALKGAVHAGIGGNDKAFITAFKLQPEILQIGTLITRSPEDVERPIYPEVATVKDGMIMVEPYVPNKYDY